jgi:hypothetical protein
MQVSTRGRTVTTVAAASPVDDRRVLAHPAEAGRAPASRSALVTLVLGGMLGIAAVLPSATAVQAFGLAPLPPMGIGGPPPIPRVSGAPPIGHFGGPLPRPSLAQPRAPGLVGPPHLRGVQRGRPGIVRGAQGAGRQAHGRSARSDHDRYDDRWYSRYGRYGYRGYGFGYGEAEGSYGASSDRCYEAYSETRGTLRLVCEED